MNWTPERLLIVGLSVLLIVAILIILRKYNQKADSIDEYGSSRGAVPKDVHRKVLKERDDLRDEIKLIEVAKFDYQNKYEKACVEISDLRRKIDEMGELLNKDSISNVLEEKTGDNNPVVIPAQANKSSQTIDGQFTKYSSFPRSAGSSIYFSDLTDKLSDDSYFELRITNDSGVASFRPLDFMKIRNYDPAMAAILTDGVKPNVASTVVGLEPGEAYLEGNDWIIKKLAKIKLA